MGRVADLLRRRARSAVLVVALLGMLFLARDLTDGRSGAITRPKGCGGEVLPAKPGGGKWRCSFDDEFDAKTGDRSALRKSRWVPQVTAASGYATGQWPYVACYVDSPDNISVSRGVLHLTVRKQPAAVHCGGRYWSSYTAGMVTTARHFSQTYGRFEVRAKLPPQAVAGLQETFWLWPVDRFRYGRRWPASGEVDFAEFYSGSPNLDLPYIHYDHRTSEKSSDTNVVTNACPIDVSRYNDYAVVWQPGRFQITINGNSCLTDNYKPGNVPSPAPFNRPFFIALTQALGVGSNAFNPSTTPLPATTNIDYVRVWK